ncbi:MAG: glutathione S-transferase family protein [Pseudomonadales bacterium]|nr:glutathione S-transferase family protein [Pseudomonadales bacterium]
MKDIQWTLYRSKISYFSGKLEAYLKYKNVPFEISEINRHSFNTIYKHTGVKKMPAMESNHGDWLFDTTPTIAWLEQQYQGVPVIPDDPALAFIALLIEDYGDEWLWRPAMWWRWVPMGSRRALGWIIGSEIIEEKLGRQAGWLFAKRQMHEWLWDDGVDKTNEATVRDMLFREFDFLEALLEDQPFILGSHPSVADYGYFGSMFRHFGNDPDSAEVMRMQAPNTYEWLARLWNAKQHKLGDQTTLIEPTADYWQPLLDRIANDYLPYLEQNAAAYISGEKRFNYKGKHINFNKTKTTHYRVWCYEVLQQKFQNLSQNDRKRVTDMFQQVGGATSLSHLNSDVVISGMNDIYKIPIKAGEKRPIKTNLAVLLGGQARN